MIIQGHFVEGYHYTVQPDGCWRWLLSLTNRGYGHVKFHYREWQAHRLAYTLERGPIPEGLCVCHSCDNPLCVNPDHLWLGTRKENQQDMICKGRRIPTSGGSNPRAKLNRHQVSAIRTAYKLGVSQAFLGACFGVCTTTIQAVTSNRNWRTE